VALYELQLQMLGLFLFVEGAEDAIIHD